MKRMFTCTDIWRAKEGKVVAASRFNDGTGEWVILAEVHFIPLEERKRILRIDEEWILHTIEVEFEDKGVLVELFEKVYPEEERIEGWLLKPMEKGG